MLISTHDADRSARRTSAHMGLLAVLISGSISCTALDPANDSCASVSSCLQTEIDGIFPEADAGTPPLWEQDAERWYCLAPNYAPPPIVPSAQPAVNLSAVVLDYASLMPIPGTTVKFCTNMDPDCNEAPQAAPVPGMAPLMNIQIRTGLLGYLRQEAPMHVTQDYFLLAPMLLDDATFVGPSSFFLLVSEPSILGFINDVGITVDRTLGIVSLVIVDCKGVRVEGAVIALPELATRTELRAARPWAINDNFPVLDRQTDQSGNAGLVNLPLGTVQLAATVNGQTFGETRIRVLGNRITSGTIRPLYMSGK